MLDDLRQAAREHDDDPFEGHEAILARKPADDKLFGMTAVERMFISIGLFGVTLVVSIILLIVTDSIGF